MQVKRNVSQSFDSLKLHMTVHRTEHMQTAQHNEQLQQVKRDVDEKGMEIEKMNDELNLISVTNVKQKNSIEITKKNLD